MRNFSVLNMILSTIALMDYPKRHIMMPDLPKQTLEQREAALAKAQARRERRGKKRRTDYCSCFFYNNCQQNLYHWQRT